MGLSEYDGVPFYIDTAKARKALGRHRELIQRLAASKYKDGDSVVTLDARDFRSPPPFSQS
jgi:hypothetical protein